MKAGKDYIGLSVGLIFDIRGRVLLGLNKYSEKKGRDYDSVWSMPGGAVEFGETAEEAPIREVREETSIDIKNIQMFSYNDYIKPDEGKHWLAINFRAYAVNSEIINREPDKFVTIEFIDPKKFDGKYSKFASKRLERVDCCR